MAQSPRFSFATPYRAALVGLVLLSAAGCSGTSQSGTNDSVEGVTSSDLKKEEVAGPALPAKNTMNEVPEDVMSNMRADLVGRLGHEELEVELAKAVTWPNGALGCPKPGMMYTQALVPGFHVVFVADGKKWDYRSSERGTPRLCEQGVSGSGYPKHATE